MTTETKTKPVHEVRFGNVRVALWANRNQENQLYHTFGLERSYRDQNGEWQTQQMSLALGEIAKVTGALSKAYEDYYSLPHLRNDGGDLDGTSGRGVDQ